MHLIYIYKADSSWYVCALTPPKRLNVETWNFLGWKVGPVQRFLSTFHRDSISINTKFQYFTLFSIKEMSLSPLLFDRKRCLFLPFYLTERDVSFSFSIWQKGYVSFSFYTFKKYISFLYFFINKVEWGYVHFQTPKSRKWGGHALCKPLDARGTHNTWGCLPWVLKYISK